MILLDVGLTAQGLIDELYEIDANIVYISRFSSSAENYIGQRDLDDYLAEYDKPFVIFSPINYGNRYNKNWIKTKQVNLNDIALAKQVLDNRYLITYYNKQSIVESIEVSSKERIIKIEEFLGTHPILVTKGQHLYNWLLPLPNGNYYNTPTKRHNETRELTFKEK